MCRESAFKKMIEDGPESWNKMLTKWRVYRICLDDSHHHPEDIIPPNWTDEEFINESERQGLVYTIDGFVEAFNLSEINENGSYIRIIHYEDNKIVKG